MIWWVGLTVRFYHFFQQSTNNKHDSMTVQWHEWMLINWNSTPILNSRRRLDSILTFTIIFQRLHYQNIWVNLKLMWLFLISLSWSWMQKLQNSTLRIHETKDARSAQLRWCLSGTGSKFRGPKFSDRKAMMLELECEELVCRFNTCIAYATFDKNRS